MSQYAPNFYPSSFDSSPSFDSAKDSAQLPQAVDLSFFQLPSDIITPSPDLFERDIDNLPTLDDAQLQLFSIPTFRPDPLPYGPASAITASSESGYDAFSLISEPFANGPLSPSYTASNYSFPLEMEMGFRGIRMSSDYNSVVDTASSIRGYSGASRHHDFGVLPPSPPISPPMRSIPKAHSDYTPAGVPSVSRQLPLRFPGDIPSTVSPHHVSAQVPHVPSVPSVLSVSDASEVESGDGRKKHQCPNCNRGEL